MRRAAGLLLICAADLGLAGALYAEMRPAAADGPALDAPASAAPAQAATPAEVPRARWATVALERPLFAPDRRPPRQERVAAGGEAMPRLAGTIRADATMLAIFAPAGDGKPEVAGPQGHVAGWTVEAIEAASVTLSRGGTTMVLRLSYAGTPAAPAPEAKPATPAVLHQKASNPFWQP